MTYRCDRCKELCDVKKQGIIADGTITWCLSCYNTMKGFYKPAAETNKETEFVNNLSILMTGQSENIDYDSLYCKIKELAENAYATETSLRKFRMDNPLIDNEFTNWFKNNCQGYTDIERDIAYAAWMEMVKRKNHEVRALRLDDYLAKMAALGKVVTETKEDQTDGN